ncbi:MAG: hypothetical protein Q4A47_00360 [Erysipelotrichaceae bacterium]|nr:hypothetical protein [Erysipelotrichaceae bacterium]MDO5085029.1 hypothetical protein [Erysipelotrichaceae bacterium]
MNRKTELYMRYLIIAGCLLAFLGIVLRNDWIVSLVFSIFLGGVALLGFKDYKHLSRRMKNLVIACAILSVMIFLSKVIPLL